MKSLAALALLFLALKAPFATSGAGAEPVNVRSQSGAFLVRGVPLGPPPTGYSTSAVQYLRLDPTLTAVSLERIRQNALAELVLKDQWRGLITVTTQPVEQDNAAVEVTSVRFKDGWGYRVLMPERVGKDVFVRTAVKVVLLEVANRDALTREAELPPWLGEGLAAHVQSSRLSVLALEPETLTTRRDLQSDPLQAAREILRRRAPLSFDELCLPSDDMLAPAHIEVYRACAQIFVQELLRLRGGREAMGELVRRLPANLNWQTTFLETFRAHFEKLIDVDKWYALTLANVVSRDPLSRWPLPASWRQLDEILATRVQVRVDASELPIDTTTSLQRIVGEWDRARQEPVLAQKVNALQALRPRIALELTGLLDGYLEVLQAHLEGRAIKLPAAPAAADEPARQPKKLRLVLRHLNALDTQREALKGNPTGQ